MRIETFDRIAIAAVVASLIFTLVVAVRAWDWFPTPGDWGHIAYIPQGFINYIALLLPPTLILALLVTRRRYFKERKGR